ncbi:OsmC family protein [Bradyrhizobium erythrophlei]|uniref:OsmC family protein n=1 Tax=Bradyrhizobium erythrophlei TaxID=1437360 RepID=UPI0035E68713
MDLETFRTSQGPYRELYASDAEAALLTLKARGTADAAAVTCKVETGRGLAIAGIHPKVGGSGRELCSGDMLLEALIACAGVSMRAAAAVLDLPLRSVVVTAEGDVDLRGTLGVTDSVPVGFKEIRLAFEIDTDASAAELDQLVQLTDKYCVIFQTIQNRPKTSVTMTRAH